MSSTVEQIKERLSAIEVVSSYIKLEKAGRNSKARCPFHNERTPSFFVSPERESYYCFGCNRGGDIFNFVQEIEGVDFLGALKILASRAGVPLESIDRRAQSEKERLHDLLDEATKFFEGELSQRPEVLAYLNDRGLTKETLKVFRVGYAPMEWRAAKNFLNAKGFNDKELLAAGLMVSGNDSSYDRFRGRIIFPIADSSGRIVAFSGRVFGDETRQTGMGKYVNSPETALYKKSKVLYGFDKARKAVRQMDACVVVEGQMDALLSVQGGMQNTVATSGTALSDDHLSLIARMTENIVFAFDADEAGVLAAEKGVSKALSRGFTVRVVALPKGLDPADIVKKDPSLWKKNIEEALHIIDFLLATIYDANQDPHVLEREISRKVLPYVLYIRSNIEQAHFVKKIAKALSLNEDPIWKELERIKKTEALPEDTPQKELQEGRTPPRKSQRDMIEKRIMGIILWQKREDKPKIDMNAALRQYGTVIGPEFESVTRDLPREEIERAIFEAALYHTESDDLEAHLRELFLNLQGVILKEHFEEEMLTLRKSEEAGDERLTAKALERCREISRELNNLSLEKMRLERI